MFRTFHIHQPAYARLFGDLDLLSWWRLHTSHCNSAGQQYESDAHDTDAVCEQT
jgi:hypothetical protein